MMVTPAASGPCRSQPSRELPGTRRAGDTVPGGMAAASVPLAGGQRNGGVTGGRITGRAGPARTGCAGRAVPRRTAPAVLAGLDRHETVAHVAHGTDQRLMLGAQLGPQPPDVHVHRAGPAEVVVAPDLLQQMRPGEHPAGMLGEELQQFELLEGQVEHAGVQPGGVGGLVDGQLAGADLVRCLGRRARLAPDGQAQPCLQLGRPGGAEQYVVGAPLGGDRGQAALGHQGQDGRPAGRTCAATGRVAWPRSGPGARRPGSHRPPWRPRMRSCRPGRSAPCAAAGRARA